jgi:hypothetical protein
MIDVTHLRSSGPGLSEAQEARLQALERSTRLTGWQAGEARFYALQGTREQQERAQRIIERAGK